MKNLILLSVMILSLSCTKTTLTLKAQTNENLKQQLINHSLILQSWILDSSSTADYPNKMQYVSDKNRIWSFYTNNYITKSDNISYKWLSDSVILADTTNLNYQYHIISLTSTQFKFYQIQGSGNSKVKYYFTKY